MKKKILAVLLMCAMLITSACTNSGDAVVTVGELSVSQSEFEYYLGSVKSQMAGTELSSEEDWQTKEIEGKKAIDLAKEKSFDTAVDNLAYIEVGKNIIELSEADQKTIKTLKDTIVQVQCGGVENYNAFIKEIGVSDSFIDTLCESEIYRRKLLEKLEAESNITDEQLDEAFKSNYRRAKHILILTQDMTSGLELSEEKKAEALTKAQNILQRAQSGEDFDALTAEFNEDPGVATNPDGYVFTDGEMVSEFEEGVDSLENGQMMLVKTSYGYHIIKKMALDETPELYKQFLESKKENIKSVIISGMLDEQLEKWKTEYNISVEKNDELYNKIS